MGYYIKATALKGEITTEIKKGTFSGIFSTRKFSISKKIIIFIIAILVTLFIQSNLDYNLKVIIFIISSWMFVILNCFITRIIAKLKKDNVYQFHSAEHMVLNAYNKLGRVPSLEEAMRFSRFYIFCGTTVLVVFLILISSIVLLVTFLSNLLAIIITFVLILILTMYLWANGYLNFLQVILTIPIDDSGLEIKTSIEGLYSLIEFEKQI